MTGCSPASIISTNPGARRPISTTPRSPRRVRFPLQLISPFTNNNKCSEKLEHVSWWIIAHGPKYCRRFLTNQKELSAKINYVSFLCKRVCRKNIRTSIESQSSTRLDHPTRCTLKQSREKYSFFVEHLFFENVFKIRFEKMREK